MIPPAPLRFSTTTGWPSRLDSPSARSRARMSVEPPAWYCTMMRTGLEGKGGSAADAAPPAARASPALRLSARPSPFFDVVVMRCLRGCRSSGRAADDQRIGRHTAALRLRPCDQRVDLGAVERVAGALCKVRERAQRI